MRRLSVKLRKNRKWSPDDLEAIAVMLAAGESPETVAKHLRRSLNAVRIRATKLRLSASSNLELRATRNDTLRRERRGKANAAHYAASPASDVPSR
jgi:hypothetical protein